MSENRITTYRDEELGDQLRRLDVPEHLPSFFWELEHRLAAESEPPRRSRRRPRRRARIRWSLAVAAAAALATALVFTVGIPRTKRTPAVAGPAVAGAAEIKARVRSSLATLHSLSGVLVSDGPKQGDLARWRFVLTAAGDLRLEGPAADEAMTYDAGAGVVRSAQHSAALGGSALFYAERSGVAPGPPDEGAPTSILQQQFAGFVEALLAAHDPRVHEVVYRGRPAWQVDINTVPNAIVPEFSGDELLITVDRQSALPVRVVERKRDGSFLREFRLDDLVVNGTVAPDAFRLAFPSGSEVMRSDDGFRRVSDLPVNLDYTPLEPDWIPSGYHLAEIAVADEAAPTGKEGGNPSSRQVVSLSYRRGFEQFLVTTRLAGDGQWSDPLASGEGFVDHPERVTIADGALRGASAQLLIAPRATPHLWTESNGIVVTVGGDLSRGDLLHVAGSLRRHG